MIRSLVRRLAPDDVARSLVTSGGLLYAAGGVSIGLTLLQQLLTARFLGAADYGRLAASLGIVLLALLVVDVRTWELGTRLMARPLEDGEFTEASRRFSWLLGSELVCGAAGSALVWVLAPLIAGTVLDEDTLSVLAVLALIIPLRQVTTGVSIAVLRMQDRFRWISVRSVLTAIVRGVAIAGPAIAGWGLTAVAVGAVIAEFFGAVSVLVLSAIAFRRASGSLPFSLHRPSCIPEAIRLARHLWVSASIKGLHVESFIPLAAVFTSPEQIGTLRASLDIANLTTHATTPLGMVFGPKIVLLAHSRRRGELQRYLGLARRALRAIVVPVVVLGVPAVLFALPQVLGADYLSVRGSAVLLLIGFGASAVTLWVRYVLVGFDRVATQNWLGLVAGVVSLAALPPLASTWGALGAAVDLMAFMVVYSTLSAWLASKVMDDVD